MTHEGLERHVAHLLRHYLTNVHKMLGLARVKIKKVTSKIFADNISIPDTGYRFSKFMVFSMAAVCCVVAVSLLVTIKRLVICPKNESGSIFLLR